MGRRRKKWKVDGVEGIVCYHRGFVGGKSNDLGRRRRTTI